MNEDEAIKLIGFFFSGKAPFENTKHLLGHASSDIPDVFMEWFGRQRDADKRVIATVLAESVVVGGTFDDYFLQTCSLLVRVADRYTLSIPEACVTKVEGLFRDREVIRRWLDHIESEDDDRKDPRSRWRFALALWNLLWVVGSPVAEKSFQTITEQASDPHFVRAIKLARSVPKWHLRIGSTPEFGSTEERSR
jgi:hypothetical protein